MRRAPWAATTACALALTIAGCAGDDEPRADPSPSSSAPTSSPPSSPSSTAPPTSSASGGTAAKPALTAETVDPLEWSPVPGSVDDTTTVSGPWTLTYPQRATSAELDGPRPATIKAPNRYRITDALIDGEYAVVVAADELETKPSVATVIDLESGKRFSVDGGSEVPTTTGGTWALGEGTLAHATIGPGRAYCLASVDLATRSSTLGWCAPPRNGFNDVRVTAAGMSLLTFDDSQPSCRTVAEVAGERLTPFPDVAKCHGWDGALLDDGAAWSVVENERRIEAAHFYARVGDGYFDLGPGTSGSLTPCAGSAYFVRDPQRDGDPARLMRWSADGTLSVVYETGGGHAALSAPRCGGDTITVTALTSRGDEQVSAPQA